MENMRYKGRTIWKKHDYYTDEVLEARECDEFEKPVPVEGKRPHGFMIAYLAEIINMIETLGNKKMKVVKYLLTAMDKRNNTLIETTREIAKNSGVSIATVVETLKTLEEANIVKRKTGAVMLSPKLMNNRTPNGEATMMITYKEFGKEKSEPEPQDIPTAPIGKENSEKQEKVA